MSIFNKVLASRKTSFSLSTCIIYIYIYRERERERDHVKPYVDNIFFPSQDEWIPRGYISAEVSISNLKILPKEKTKVKKGK